MAINQYPLQPIARAHVMELVAEQLISLIRDGHYKPGDQIPSQKELVQMLHVSRPTLREALSGLAMLGYIEVRAGEGYFVREMKSSEALDFSVISALVSNQTIEDLYEARGAVEAEIAALAAIRATESDIERLREFLQQIEAALPSAEALVIGVHFHELVAEAAHNPILSQIEAILLDLFRQGVPRMFAESPTYQRHVILHKGIVEAIAAHDPERARAAAFTHTRVFAGEFGLEGMRYWGLDAGHGGENRLA